MFGQITGFITFFTDRGIPLEFVLFGLFLVFLWVLSHVFDVLVGGIKVAIISAAFAFALSYVGYTTLTLQNVLFWINVGLIVYFIYLVLRSGLAVLEILKKVIDALLWPFRKLWKVIFGEK